MTQLPDSGRSVVDTSGLVQQVNQVGEATLIKDMGNWKRWRHSRIYFKRKAMLMRIFNFLLISIVLTLAGCKGESTDSSINRTDTSNLADKAGGEVEGEVEGALQITSNTDIQRLQKITSISGLPKNVWWVYEAMGSSSARSVPGPTDYALTAIIDYGSTEAVAELIGDNSGQAKPIDNAQWFPDFLAPYVDDEGTIQTQMFRKVQGFHPHAAVLVLDELPSHVILWWTTT